MLQYMKKACRAKKVRMAHTSMTRQGIPDTRESSFEHLLIGLHHPGHERSRKVPLTRGESSRELM
jgi:hypothetical protein